MIPGEILTAAGRDRAERRAASRSTLEVANTGDRPIQVGCTTISSRPTRRCDFDRDAGARHAARHRRRHRGALRARPDAHGASSSPYAGARDVLRLPARSRASWRKRLERWPTRISRARLCRACSGRPTGDRVRLADTDLFIEVEKDRTDLRRGGEVRRRQGDPRRHGPDARRTRAEGARRHRHHQRADPRPLGHRQGRHRHQGRPHRRHRQGRQPRHPARRRHRHRPGHRGRSPARARSSPPAASTATSTSSARSRSRRRCTRGITTMIGGGTGPATGTIATTCTPGPGTSARMLQAAEALADEPRLPRQGQRQPARRRCASRSRPAPAA